MKRVIAFAAIGLWLTILPGCGGASGDAPREAEAGMSDRAETQGAWDLEPELAWSLVPDLRIGSVEGEGADVFGRIRNLILDGSGGVWVFDWQAFELRHFGADGEHVVSVGRRGEGPGEFTGNACARVGVTGEVWVETETSWHRFDYDGQLLGTFPTPSRMACAVRAWLPDGRYLVADGGFDLATRQPQSHFVIHEWTGDRMIPVDTVEQPEHAKPQTVTFVRGSGSSSTAYLPFVHNPASRLEKGGQFWVWDGGGAYDTRLQTSGGDTIRRLARQYTPEPIGSEVRRQAIDDLQRPGWEPETDFDPSQIPRVYPPFSSMRLADDGTVWVRRQTGEEEVTWEVFGDDDRFWGAIEMPESLKGMDIRHIGVEYVWGIVRDEFDVQYVVRARITKPVG
jgi:hypothetical protein